MKRKRVLEIVIDYLEYNYEDFQEYLEVMREIEGSEAELIIDKLKKIMGRKKMKLRRAIIQYDGISAECPMEGYCQGAQITQGKMMTFICPHYDGTHRKTGSLYVRCSCSGPECKH